MPTVAPVEINVDKISVIAGSGRSPGARFKETRSDLPSSDASTAVTELRFFSALIEPAVPSWINIC